jgi:predicted transcriptional regulator
MVRLGELEQRVIAVLWAAGDELTVRDVATHFPDHAYTTVMTVLDRLERKGMVTRRLVGRAHRYVATGTREQYAAALMREALDSTPHRSGVLVHFAESATEEEIELLKRILNGESAPGSEETG